MTDMKVNRRQMLAAGVATGVALTACQSVAAQGDADLSGKSVLITGCSSGFGYLGALHYAERGAKVFATMRNMPRPEADQLSAAVKDGGDLTIIELDVLSDESVTKAIAEAERLNGGALDVVINNAGVGTGARRAAGHGSNAVAL